MKEIVVENPMECPLNSECQCGLSGEEGVVAKECPEGEYPDYEFPVNCPLAGNDYLINRRAR